MPKKKSSKSSGDLFNNHSNLKWLLPLFIVIVLVSIVVIKHARETGADQVSFGDKVRYILHMSPDNDQETMDDNSVVSTPSAPTTQTETPKSY